MEAPQIAPLEESDAPPQLRLVKEDAETELDNWMAGPESFRVQVFRDDRDKIGPVDVHGRPPDYYWSLNGKDMGDVDWATEGERGDIDTVTSVPEVVSVRDIEIKVRKAGWQLIAICMHHLNDDIEVINTPAGRIVFH